MSAHSDAEQLLLSKRMEVLENKVQHLINDSVAKMTFMEAVAEVENRLKVLEAAQKPVGVEADASITASETSLTPAAPELCSRITTLETSLHELGTHFVKYQEDLVGILAKKFKVFVQQIHVQEDRIQGLVQEAIRTTKEQMKDELDSTRASTQYMSRQESTSGNTKSNWDTFTGETASITASEESEKHEELVKLMLDARRDIDVMYGDIRAHAKVTERRLAALEIGHVSHHQKINDISNSANEEFTFEAKIKPPPLKLPSNVNSTLVKSPRGMKQLSVTEFDPVLQGLMNAVNQCCRPSGQPTSVQGTYPITSSLNRTQSPGRNGLYDAPTRAIGVETTRSNLETAAQTAASKTIATPSMGDRKVNVPVETVRTLSPSKKECVGGSLRTLPQKPSNVRGSSSGTASVEAPSALSRLESSPRSLGSEQARAASFDATGIQSLVPKAKQTPSNNVGSPSNGSKSGGPRHSFPFAKPVQPSTPSTVASNGASPSTSYRPLSARQSTGFQANGNPSPPELRVQSSTRTCDTKYLSAAAFRTFNPQVEARQVRKASPSPPPQAKPQPVSKTGVVLL
mmetsp:Transcript_81586/g.142242  ORF Transcript_81586/g.142242 Transcript_81586/m.142242 type:complete len:572 (+) Transcript_81586:113-1828(+)